MHHFPSVLIFLAKLFLKDHYQNIYAVYKRIFRGKLLKLSNFMIVEISLWRCNNTVSNVFDKLNHYGYITVFDLIYYQYRLDYMIGNMPVSQ